MGKSAGGLPQARLLQELLNVPTVDAARFTDAPWLDAWTRNLEARLNAASDLSRSYRLSIRKNEAGQPVRLDLVRTEHGVATEKHLQREFFDSAEYRRIAELGRTLVDLLGPGAYVAKAEQRQDVATFQNAMSWLLEQARKGQSIQRYKGLGEMNPDQLWDTTVAADDIFTTLMGDAVEPRREFIEKNALSVANLDV